MGSIAQPSQLPFLKYTYAAHYTGKLLNPASNFESNMVQCLFCGDIFKDIQQHKKHDHGHIYFIKSGVSYDPITHLMPTGVLACSDTSSRQQCSYTHRNFTMLKKHLKLEYRCIAVIKTSISSWEDPPWADGMDVDSDPGILMPYRCIICHICEHAITTSGLRDHFNGKEHLEEVGENKIYIPLANVKQLQCLWLEFNMIRDLTKIEHIPHQQPALPSLKITSGFSCQHCNPSSISTSCPQYFEVLTPTAPHRDPWLLYVDQIGSQMPPKPTINLVSTVNEVLLLLKDTGWHIFLADIIPYVSKVNEYITWIALPPTAALDGWEMRLKPWILKYMKTIQGEQPQNTTFHWTTTTASLYHFLLAIVRSSHNAESIKRLSLASDDLDKVRSPLHTLNHSEDPNIGLIYEVFVPICYHRKAPSKWNNPMECLMTLYAFRDQGRFATLGLFFLE
ncbi:hypothetical protein M422DRAFT_243488 [Sphaerobolus stellatus SS14]|nr:hypothetical protein M422DRAFT_243488 [Sphaerobolus stellatus SS14]